MTFYWIEFWYLGQVHTLDRLGPLPTNLTEDELKPHVVARWDDSAIGWAEISILSFKPVS